VRTFTATATGGSRRQLNQRCAGEESGLIVRISKNIGQAPPAVGGRQIWRALDQREYHGVMLQARGKPRRRGCRILSRLVDEDADGGVKHGGQCGGILAAPPSCSSVKISKVCGGGGEDG
jgi:hypothetical protein